MAGTRHAAELQLSSGGVIGTVMCASATAFLTHDVL